jgi:hypothetical protein
MAKEQIIGERCGSRSELPERMTALKPESSRLLEGLNKGNISGSTPKGCDGGIQKEPGGG